MSKIVKHKVKKELPYYAFWGDGSPLLMIHGYMVKGEMFYPLVESYSDRYEVIVPDLRGYGKNKEMKGPYTTQQHAEDMIGILDELGIKKAHVMGYSMGGTITQYLAVNFPERVRSIVLGCTFTFKQLTPLERMQRGIIRTVIERIGSRGIMRLITTQFGDLAGNELDVKTAVWLRRMLADNNDNVLLHSLDEIFKFDYRPFLKKIKAPTLVVGAGLDLVVPIHHSQMLAQGIENAKYKMIPNTGHGLIHTHLEEFVAATRGFIDEADAATQAE